MDNYFNYLPDGIKIVILGKLNYNNFKNFCDLFATELCENKSTCRILIKNNYPELYKSLFITGYLNDPRLDLSFYYLYKERLSFVINYDMYAERRRIMSEMVGAHPDQIIERLQMELYTTIKESNIKDIIIILMSYRNWPGSYLKIKEIIEKNRPSWIEEITTIYNLLMFGRGRVQSFYSADMFNSLLYSMRFNSPIMDEYLIKGKLDKYPSLRKLSESLPPTRLVTAAEYFYMAYNYMFLFLYSREPDVDINDFPEIKKLVSFLAFVSKEFGYDIDWLIDKLNKKNVNIIYRNIIREEGNLGLSIRETIKWYYENKSDHEMLVDI